MELPDETFILFITVFHFCVRSWVNRHRGRTQIPPRSRSPVRVTLLLPVLLSTPASGQSSVCVSRLHLCSQGLTAGNLVLTSRWGRLRVLRPPAFLSEQPLRSWPLEAGTCDGEPRGHVLIPGGPADWWLPEWAKSATRIPGLMTSAQQAGDRELWAPQGDLPLGVFPRVRKAEAGPERQSEGLGEMCMGGGPLGV